ncbi:hypothetical protein KCU71_g27, partial [Aureobasidium melanogenum]
MCTLLLLTSIDVLKCLSVSHACDLVTKPSGARRIKALIVCDNSRAILLLRWIWWDVVELRGGDDYF